MERIKIAKRIQDAIKNASYSLEAVGYDANVLNKHDFVKYRRFDSKEERTALWYHDRYEENPYEEPLPTEDPEMRKQAEIITKLQEIRPRFGRNQANGAFATRAALHLKVTYPGCAFDGEIDQGIDGLLPQWYDKAAVSGYGNVKKQETEVNLEVRNAREIPAEHLEVSDDVLKLVKDTWACRFLPSNVRVEPYKIHIYGPDGRFLPHRDTPEKDLVGTFLLGLGDTTPDKETPNLRVAQRTYRADAKNWVAFYPDVDHEVTPLKSGYRAVLAFKLFRAGDAPPPSVEDDVGSSESEGDDSDEGKKFARTLGKARVPEAIRVIQDILADVPLPIGLYLTHKYPRGMTEPSGFDAILLQAANTLPNIEARLLPVIVDERVVLQMDTEEEPNDQPSTASAEVYPISDVHLNYLIGDITEEALLKDETGAWTAKLRDIPFYSITTEDSYSYSRERNKPGEVVYHESDQIGWTGNECRADDDHSIYMSYSLIFTPAPPEKALLLAKAAAVAKDKDAADKGKKTEQPAQATNTAKAQKVAGKSDSTKETTAGKAIKTRKGKAAEKVDDAKKGGKKAKAGGKTERKKSVKSAAASAITAASHSNAAPVAEPSVAVDASNGRYNLRKRKADAVEAPVTVKAKRGAVGKKARK